MAERVPGTYPLPKALIASFLLAAVFGRRRDLARDVKSVLARGGPPRRVVGADLIPSEGPFVLIANHYEARRLKVWWGGMLLTAAVYDRRAESAGEQPTLRWLMTSEWYNFRLGGVIPVPVWFLRWLFRRIANVFGLVIVPRSPERVAGRAAAMRSILEAVERLRAPIGMYPEGVGQDVLIEAMPGTGLFLHSLSRRGIPLLPAGVYEDGGVLTVRFGEPFRTALPREAAKGERDSLARAQIMSRIGALLPPEMWGPYAAEVEETLSRPGGGAPG